MRTLATLPRSARRGRSDVVATSSRGERRGFQIGPKIRIGGSVGKIGQNVKNAVVKGVKDEGHFVGKVASNPWVQGLTEAALVASGVGAPAAAAIMAAEKGGGALLKPGGNIGDAVKGGATGAVMGYGGAKLGGLARSALNLGSQVPLGGAGGAAGDVIGGDASGIPGIGADGGVVDPSTGLPAGGGGSSWWDKAKSVFGGAKDAIAGGKGSGLDKVLAGAGLVSSYLDKKRQEDLQNKGLGFATDSYNERAPLRQFGLSMLTPGATVASPTASASAGSRIPASQALLDAAKQTGGSY